MSKQKSQVKQQVKSKQSLGKEKPRDTSLSIPEKYQTPVFLGIILILLLIFFNEGIFGGKVFSSADNLASASFNNFLDDATKQGIYAQWIPYIFNGMPSFAALIPFQERTYDLMYALYMYVRNAAYMIGGNTSVWHVMFFYLVFAVNFYFYANYKFKDKLAAFYCALAAVFITPIIQMIIVGHNSKMIAVMMFPLVLLFIDKIYDYISNKDETKGIFNVLLLFCGLVFSLHVQMSSNHIQMLYYFFMALGIYIVYRLIFNLIKKIDVSSAAKTLGIFIVAIGLSAAMYSDSYLSIREYNKYSIRGQPAITTQLPENQGKGPTEPLDYEYATNWSFSPTEVLTLFNAYWAGFGDVEYQKQRVNTYWGQMPFTSNPMYFGIITMLLGIIGIYYNFRKSAVVQTMVVLAFFSLLLSFGRTFPILFDLFFYNMPFFSSFRAPVMVHILLNVSFVILAGYGIKTIIEIAKDKSRSSKLIASAKYVFPILALPILISLIGFEGYYSSEVASSPLVQKLQQQGANPQQVSQYVKQITEVAYSNVKSEMLVIGLLLLAAYALIYYYVKGSLKYQSFGLVLILVMMIDLWHIDFKTLHWDNKTDMESYFKTPDWVDWMLKTDKNTYEYRVLNLQNNQPVRENTLAYWRLNNIYGYQGAKLRIFQDMDDVVGLTNPNGWKVMNTKYIISDKEFNDTMFTTVFKGSKFVMLNKNFYPHAFFVNSYQTAQPIDILNSIKDGKFDPKQMALLEKDPGVKVDAADSTAKVMITNFSIHSITLDAEASGNNLLYLSEVYYPAGWKAFIDGAETEIYKTNYLFRSIIVPKGKHKIEFKYENNSYVTGKNISMGANLVLIIIFGIALGGFYVKKKKSAEIAEKQQKEEGEKK